MEVQRENLAYALSLVIKDRRRYEKSMNFTSDSAFVAGLVDTLNAICEHKPIELVGDIQFDTHSFIAASRKPL